MAYRLSESTDGTVSFSAVSKNGRLKDYYAKVKRLRKISKLSRRANRKYRGVKDD